MKVLTDRDILVLLRRTTGVEGVNGFARAKGMSAAHVSRTLSGLRPVGEAVAEALGCERVWVRRSKGRRNL